MLTETHFISVEVVIRTNANCDDWIAWFERLDNHVTNMPEENYASFVYFAPLPLTDANATIQRLCREISELPEHVLQQWMSADEREFFVGYETGETPNCFMEHLDTATIEMVNRHEASIRIALYATQGESD